MPLKEWYFPAATSAMARWDPQDPLDPLDLDPGATGALSQAVGDMATFDHGHSKRGKIWEEAWTWGSKF